MLKSVNCRIVVPGLLTLGWASAWSQSASYHFEPRPRGTAVTNVFVNDGPRPVEAFAAFERSGTNGAQQMSVDYLDVAGGFSTTTSAMLRSPEHRRGQHNLAAQGDGYQTFTYGPAQIPGYPEVKAVIFSDGSTEGDPVRLAAMQATRDGYSDEVNFWVMRLNAEDPAEPKWDALAAEGAAREKVAEARQNAHHVVAEEPLDAVPDQGKAYWRARAMVARLVRDRAIPDYEKRLGFGVMRNTFIGWKDKIDSNEAKRVLEAKYPLPEAIKAEAETAYPPAAAVQAAAR